MLLAAFGSGWSNTPGRAAGEPEPLWVHDFSTPPALGDKAVPQSPPSLALRPNEDPLEQTRLRRVAGSSAMYSWVDIRDLGNVIDWFPGDHPPMSQIIAHGSPSLGNAARGCASCHLPTEKGRPENTLVTGLPVACPSGRWRISATACAFRLIQENRIRRQ